MWLGSSAVSPSDGSPPTIWGLLLWTSEGGAAIRNKSWAWPEVGMPGRAAREQCLWGRHRWWDNRKKEKKNDSPQVDVSSLSLCPQHHWKGDESWWLRRQSLPQEATLRELVYLSSGARKHGIGRRQPKRRNMSRVSQEWTQEQSDGRGASAIRVCVGRRATLRWHRAVKFDCVQELSGQWHLKRQNGAVKCIEN